VIDVGRHGSEGLTLAQATLDRALAAGATEAEVLVTAEDAALTRFANSEIHQNVAESNVGVNLRFVVGRRVAVAATGRTDEDGLRALVERAAAIVANVDELADWGGLPEPVPGAAVQRPGSFVAATAEATPEARAEGVRAAIAAADEVGVMAYGSFRTAAETVAVANSRGIAVAERRSIAHLITVHMSPDGGSGYAETASADVALIDAAGVGREAAAKARASDRAVAIEAGEYPVVLEEYAVVDLADALGYLGFSATAVREGRSFYEPGKRIGSELVTIADDAADPAGLPAGFDYEGVAKEPVVLVDRGVCGGLLFDAQSAARAGRRSTGHAYPAPNPYGPLPANLVITAGSTPREALVGGLERGLLVTRFWYTNTVHPKLAIVTGMTRDGTFLVEGGRIVGPVRNLRFTQSYLDALAGVSAVARERRTIVGGFGPAVVPALRIDGWTFTGTTEH